MKLFMQNGQSLCQGLYNCIMWYRSGHIVLRLYGCWLDICGISINYVSISKELCLSPPGEYLPFGNMLRLRCNKITICGINMVAVYPV